MPCSALQHPVLSILVRCFAGSCRQSVKHALLCGHIPGRPVSITHHITAWNACCRLIKAGRPSCQQAESSSMDPPWGRPEPLDRETSPQQGPRGRPGVFDYSSKVRQTLEDHPGARGGSSPRQTPWGQPEPVDRDTTPRQAQRAKRQSSANQRAAAPSRHHDQTWSGDSPAERAATSSAHDTAKRLSASAQSMPAGRDSSNELDNANERRPLTDGAAYPVEAARPSQEGQHLQQLSSLHEQRGGSTAVQQRQAASRSDASTYLSSQEQQGRNAKIATKPVPAKPYATEQSLRVRAAANAGIMLH